MPFLVAEAAEYLVRANQLGRLAHAFLITGPDGSGKLALAKQLYSTINKVDDAARDPDFHLVQPESKSRRILVEQIRALEVELRLRSTTGKLKFGVIVDADRMMTQSANAFLKTLEEPPNGSLLLLLTSLPEALLETIRSRCVILPLRSPHLREVEPAERAFFDALAELANERRWTVGSALALARQFQDQLACIRNDIEAEHDERLKRDSEIYRNSTDGKWLEQEEGRLDVLTESRYVRARMAFVEKILEWFGDTLRARQGGEARDLNDYRDATAGFAREIPVPDLLDRIRAFQELREHLYRNVQEGLAIEVAFLRGFGPSPAIGQEKRRMETSSTGSG
jgi:DNA polymerase-3 subunit delta'